MWSSAFNTILKNISYDIFLYILLKLVTLRRVQPVLHALPAIHLSSPILPIVALIVLLVFFFIVLSHCANYINKPYCIMFGKPRRASSSLFIKTILAFIGLTILSGRPNCLSIQTKD